MRVGDGDHPCFAKRWQWAVFVTVAFLSLCGCGTLPSTQVIYDRQGIRVGIETDPSISRGAPAIRNSHPVTITFQEVRQLLGTLQVSGWSGTVVGLFESPRPIPLFEAGELAELSRPASLAFQQAGPGERVFFTLANLKTPYNEDRTSGALFIREPYLHVVVTDHRAYTRADTAGGDEKDPRDTKGMKLWVTGPYRAAAVPPEQEPKWAPFETVHISLNMKDIAATRRLEQNDKALLEFPSAGRAAPSIQELQLQIRELTQSNQELRKRLEEQSRQMNDLKRDLEKLNRDQTEAGKKPKLPPKPAPRAP